MKDRDTQLRRVRKGCEAIMWRLDERSRRLWAAAEARALGHGGVTLVREATGLSRTTITQGLHELDEVARDPAGEASWKGRIRAPGGGRKRATEHDPTLLEDLETLVNPLTRGDPESPLRWTCKSHERLAEELRAMGHEVSRWLVRQLLGELGYSLQAPRKSLEGKQHPHRDQQFEHLNATVEKFQARGQPVISVDTKKKELVGEYANGGREYQPKGAPVKVKIHDFPDPSMPKAIPYGVYDVARNEGWVNVGIDHDTAEFAVESIGRWWRRKGREEYPAATELLITADAGGSNGYRSRLWAATLQGLADEIGLPITVCHFPPGTSKWNKIEHRMFCHISENWRGRPLTSYEAVVNLIGAVRTRAGLTIDAVLDERSYPTGMKVSQEEMDDLSIIRHEFHGEWNYTISPSQGSLI